MVTLLVGIDQARTLDLVNISILLEKLYTFGFSNTASKWVESYLTERSQTVFLPNGETSSPLIRLTVFLKVVYQVHYFPRYS